MISLLLNEIIDDLNSDYTPLTDEFCLYDGYTLKDEYGVYQREFKHIKTGRNFLLEWVVWYGTPETAKTVFENPIEITNEKVRT